MPNYARTGLIGALLVRVEYASIFFAALAGIAPESRITFVFPFMLLLRTPTAE